MKKLTIALFGVLCLVSAASAMAKESGKVDRTLTVISFLDEALCKDEGFYWYKSSFRKNSSPTCHGCPMGKIAHRASCSCPLGFVESAKTGQCLCPTGASVFFDRMGAHCRVNENILSDADKAIDAEMAAKSLNEARQVCEANPILDDKGSSLPVE